MPHYALHLVTQDDKPKNPIAELLSFSSEPKAPPTPIAVAASIIDLTKWMVMNPEKLQITNNQHIFIMEIPNYDEYKAEMDKAVHQAVQKLHASAQANLDEYRTNVEPKMVSVVNQ